MVKNIELNKKYTFKETSPTSNLYSVYEISSDKREYCDTLFHMCEKQYEFHKDIYFRDTIGPNCRIFVFSELGIKDIYSCCYIFELTIETKEFLNRPFEGFSVSLG